MTDDETVQLLEGLATYYEHYSGESDPPHVMTIRALATDLIGSLPHELEPESAYRWLGVER